MSKTPIESALEQCRSALLLGHPFFASPLWSRMKIHVVPADNPVIRTTEGAAAIPTKPPSR